MADDALAPGMFPANISRRSLMKGGAVALPLATPLAVPDQQSWTSAIAHYLAARQAHADFIASKYKPATAALNAEAERLGATLENRGNLFAKYDIAAMEDKGGDLLTEQHDSMRALAILPAPDLPALRQKIEILYFDVFSNEPDYGMLFGQLTLDIARLIPS